MLANIIIFILWIFAGIYGIFPTSIVDVLLGPFDDGFVVLLTTVITIVVKKKFKKN